MDYRQWCQKHMFAVALTAAYMGGWLRSFKEIFPRQKPGGFNLYCVMDAVTASSGAVR
jgi:hypothetical protein